MSATAPFPQPGFPGATHALGTPIPSRKEYVPAWCPWASGQFSADPDKVIVRFGGEPLEPEFTVSEVLPERRWAIQENGELLEGIHFQDKYQRKLEDWFHVASPEALTGQPTGIPKSFRVHNEPVPNPRDYVAWTLDKRDSDKLVPIGFDPEATKGARPTRLWDSENERWLEGHERMNALVRAYREEENGGRLTLRPYEREEVQRHLAGGGTAGGGMNEVQAKLEMLRDLRQRRKITEAQFASEVADLFGVDEDEEPELIGKERAKDPNHVPRGYTRMACGEDVLNFGKKKHVGECDTCTEALARWEASKAVEAEASGKG